MNLFNNEIYSDILLQTSEGNIFCHKAYLVKIQPFKNLIYNQNLSVINITEHFPHFDEKTVLSYVKYLYDAKIDYENIIEFKRRDLKFGISIGLKIKLLSHEKSANLINSMIFS